MNRKIESLIEYLKDGDIKSPLAWSLSEWDGGAKVHDLETNPPLPTWVTTKTQSHLSDNRFSYSNRQYFTSIAKTGEEVHLDPPEKFDGLELSVLDISKKNRIQIKYKTQNGDWNNKTITFHDSSFNESNSIPFSIDLKKPAERAIVSLHSDSGDSSLRMWLQSSNTARKVSTEPRLTLPSIQQIKTGGFPIFLISVDTFRHDFLDTFSPVIEALGSDAVVPSEPRTQGHWTRPSHASTLTGVHPGEHGYVAGAGDDIEYKRISKSLTTLAEFLSEQMYRCSGCVSQSSLSGAFGFARGFHRYELQNMSWEMRENDAKKIADKGIQWIHEDATLDSNKVFHFLHFFDPHYPYIPPFPVQEEEKIDIDFISQWKDRRRGSGYIETVENPTPEVPAEEQQKIQKYYRQSLQYTAKHIRRYISELKHTEVYQNAFIMILGDHGEGLYDRGFATHSTLYDQNIRPGCILKLPASIDFDVPDRLDYIDLFPTIAEMLNESPPSQCMGQSCQSYSNSPRITERIGADSYSVAVEINGRKGIFTYPSRFPKPPKSSDISDGPIMKEFFKLSKIRNGNTDSNTRLSSEMKSKLLSEAEKFASRNISTDTETASIQPSKKVEEQLEKLGYK